MTSLLLRYSGEVAAAEAALAARGNGGLRVIAPSDLRPRARRLGLPPAERLAVLGGPPEDEIGYGLAALAALAARPREVAVLDDSTGSARVQRTARFLASAGPAAALQLGSSAAAIGVQRALVALPPGPVLSRPGAELERVVYLRPVVGTPAAVGGSITHSHEVIRALVERGVDVDCVTTDRLIADTASRDSGLPFRWRTVTASRAFAAVPASSGLGGDAALVRAALASARNAGAIYQRHARFSLAGALLSRLAGVPLILEYNGSEAWIQQFWTSTPFASQLLACEEAALAAAARIIVVADVERRSLVERGVDESRIVVNPNGVDPRRFAVGGGDRIRERHGLTSDHVVFGFTGTFGPWHGVPVLARAFLRIAERLPEARLLLLGDGPERPEVAKLLAPATAEGRVVFVDRVEPHEVPAYLDACDVLESPHVWRSDGGEFFGSPTKLFEYMAARRPIVASALGQIASVLEHERSALLVEPGDVDQLVDASLRLARDPDLRARLAAGAREAAEQRHTWTANVQRVIDAWATLPERPRR